MDPVSPKGVSASEDVIQPEALKKPCTEPSQCNCHFPENISIDELGNSLSEFLLVQDGQILPSKSILCHPLDKPDNPDAEMEHDFEDPDQTESAIATSEKCLFKCATFPCTGMKFSDAVPIDGEGCESGKNAYPRSISLPTHFKLVSALKGSREKQGTSPKKLTVTWAPDVYDPPPSAPTLVRNNRRRPKNERKKYDKKNGKIKQKGRPSKGGGGKDKKLVRKCSESSNICYQGPKIDSAQFECNEPSDKLEGFGVGGPDSNCGSSFLKKSVTKMQFSIAEATYFSH